MKLKYLFFYLVILFTLSFSSLQGQDDNQSEDLTCLMYNASILNSEILWERAISIAKSKYESSNKSEDLLQLCYAYYGRVGNCLSNRKSQKDNGERTAKLGLKSANKLSLDSNYESLANSLLAGFNGMLIAFSPMKGMMLGPKSDKQVSKSLELNPENPIGWLQKGSSQFNTPSMFGGSPKKSIDSFKKSIAYFEADDSKPLWMKIEAMIWLGQAYHYTKNYEKARATYKDVLNIESNHGWIVNILLPATVAKIENK